MTLHPVTGKKISKRARNSRAMRELLAETWPQAFVPPTSLRPKQPLKHRILDDILDRWPSLFPAEVAAALEDYCNGARYLSALQAGATRIDLDGQAAGLVTTTQANHAQRALRKMLAHNAVQQQHALAQKGVHARLQTQDPNQPGLHP